MSPFIRRVRIKNYKSIAACDVSLSKLTFLVGRNGAGKSNFLDAIRFISDSLRSPLDHALRDRGGINEVRRRSGGHPTHFGIRIDYALPNGGGHYAFRIGAEKNGGFSVVEERCQVDARGGPHFFHVESGCVVKSSITRPPAAVSDRLFLVNASGLPEFRELYDALCRMGFYNLNPVQMRELQSPDPADVLLRDGRNIARILARLDPATRERVQEYLSKVVPDIRGVEARELGPKETIEFRQEVVGAKHPWKFLAAQMSDGTLRALGVLMAVFQRAGEGAARPSFVGIEEPETALHPGAAGVLRDCLDDASSRVQIAVTSHSPDLLDSPYIDPASLLAVVQEAGETRIGPVHSATTDILQQHLFTAGELLRMDQLAPDPGSVPEQGRLKLFGDEAAL